MGTQVESRERTGHGYVPTGDLPPPEMVKVLMSEAYEHFRSNAEGRNSDICPALVRVPPATCSARAWLAHNGNLYAVGDANDAFSIMSVSKPFVFALVCQSIGGEQARERLGATAPGCRSTRYRQSNAASMGEPTLW